MTPGRRACLLAGAAVMLVGQSTSAAQSADEVPLAERIRRKLVADGEAALASGDTRAAGELFERAGRMAHEADAELGMVRAMMQTGQYRRALGFAAHVAGVHLDNGGGPAMYAWLLLLGGRADLARSTLESALARLPGDGRLIAVRDLLDSPSPVPSAILLAPPLRFAPESPESTRVPIQARHVASGVLLQGGRLALTESAPLGSAVRAWVRDGLGRVAEVRVPQPADRPAGLVALQLDVALPHPSGELLLAARDPFSGSPAFAIGYPAGLESAAAWPLMRIGFLGASRASDGAPALGFEVPEGLRGGAVFDANGTLAGIALAGGGDRPRLVPPSALRSVVADLPAATEPRGRQTPDACYEEAMGRVVQVLV
jgi:hypothetical protein